MKIVLLLILASLNCYVGAQSIVDYSVSSCDGQSFPEYMRHRIVSKEFRSDTLYLTISFSENCCFSPDPQIEMIDGKLDLTRGNKSQLVCGCDCCFEMNFVIAGMNPFVGFTIEGREWHENVSKYGFILPDHYDLTNAAYNSYNDSRQKIGLWRTYYWGTSKIKNESYYWVFEDGKHSCIWSKKFNKDGELTRIYMRTSHGGTSMSKSMYEELLKSVQ